MGSGLGKFLEGCEHATAHPGTALPRKVTPTGPWQAHMVSADADINTHTDSWPPGLHSQVTGLKTSYSQPRGRDERGGAEAGNHLVQIKIAHSGPQRNSQSLPSPCHRECLLLAPQITCSSGQGLNVLICTWGEQSSSVRSQDHIYI